MKWVIPVLASILILGTILVSISFDDASATHSRDNDASAYIQFSGIEGESHDPDHPGWSDLESFSWSATALQKDNGKLKGKSSLVEVTVAKLVDKATPIIMQFICQGKKCTPIEMTVDICRIVTDDSGAETQQCYLRYELEEAIISSYSVDSFFDIFTEVRIAPPDDQIPTETISLNFEKIKITYTPYDSEGNPDRPIVGFYETGDKPN